MRMVGWEAWCKNTKKNTKKEIKKKIIQAGWFAILISALELAFLAFLESSRLM